MRSHNFANDWVQMWIWFAAVLEVMNESVNDFYFPVLVMAEVVFLKMYRHLVKSSNEVNYDFKILNAVMEVNEKQKLHLIPKIKKYFKNDLKGKNFALWGLAFKPNTDDIREAPALYMIDALTSSRCYSLRI